MQWDKDKSIKLSKICILMFAAALAVAVVAGPFLIKIIWYPAYKHFSGSFIRYVITAYAIPSTYALFVLYKLLGNIEKGEVFTEGNIKIMRYLSWRCFIVTIVSIFFSYKMFSALVIAAAAFLMGMLLRVVKNVFVRALEIKTENDFTI